MKFINQSSEGDRGILYGDGVFETMRVGPEGVWQVEKHTNRLLGASIYFDLMAQARRVIEEIKNLKMEKECLVRITLIRDQSSDISPFSGDKGGIYWDKRELPFRIPPTLVGMPGLYVPGFEPHDYKTTSFLRNVKCKLSANSQGYQDGVMLSKEGWVGETSTANIWAVFDDHVVTPKGRGIVSGITRAVILEKNLGGLPIEVRPLLVSELTKAKEVALSSVGIGVVSATCFHEKALRGPTPSLGSVWAERVNGVLFDS